MNKYPLVSVIIPVYKTEKYLKQCVDSVISQSYKFYEIILVDDGSPDNCPQICDEYAKKYRNIMVIHKANGGLSSARNEGIKGAKGKYILFVDSDDSIERHTLEDAVNAAENTQAEITIFGIHTMIYFDGELQTERYVHHDVALYTDKNAVNKAFPSFVESGMWNQVYDKLYLKTLIVDNNIWSDGFYDRVCEDTVFLFEVFPHINRVCVISGCYYNYAIRNNQSVVSTFIPERYEKYYGKWKNLQKIILDANLQETASKLLYKEYCIHILWAYEFLFHQDCTFSLPYRRKYMKQLFSIRKEEKDFTKAALCFFESSNIAKKASITSKKVVELILKDRYFEAWIVHCIALIKFRITEKGTK